MASDEHTSALQELLNRAKSPLPEVTWETADDVARMSAESMVVAALGNARGNASRGRLRLHGPGVHGHRARLSAVSQITAAWQKAVTAVGASLEGHTSAAGQVKADIRQRTELMLSAAPSPGSVILTLEPFTFGVTEVEPDGQLSMDGQRPLADRASERLITLCRHLAVHDLDYASTQAAEIRELGPRVASTVLGLATSVASANVALDAAWEEPEHPTARVTWGAGVGQAVREFVEGRDLAAYEEKITGIALTLSVSERWRIDTGESVVFVDATNLDAQVRRAPHLQNVVEIRTRVSTRQRADGTERISREALDLRVLDDRETNAWIRETGVLPEELEGD